MKYNALTNLMYKMWRTSLDRGQPQQTVCLLGSPGIGKTQSNRTLCQMMTDAVKSDSALQRLIFGANVPTNIPPAISQELDLSSMLPEDLNGLPFRDEGSTKFCAHEWLRRLCTPGAYGVLVLDDLPASAPMMQVAARQCALERRIHDHHLSPGVFIIVTGNRREDKSAASTLPAHFRNSVVLLDVDLDIDEWAIWYGQQPYHSPLVPAFLRFKQDRLSMLPKDADKRGAFATPRCYDPQTEVLTRRGFVAWPNVLPSDEFAQLDPSTGVANFAKPERFIKVRHKGQMVRFKHQHIDLLVTPNHNMLVARDYASGGNNDPPGYARVESVKFAGATTKVRNKVSFDLIPAEDVVAELNERSTYAFRMRKDAFFAGLDNGYKHIGGVSNRQRDYPARKIKWPVWAEFLGWYLTDGSLHDNGSKIIQITQVEDEARQRVAALFSEVSTGNVSIQKDRVRVVDPALYAELEQFGKKHDGQRFVPRDILEKGSETARALINGAFGGDGWLNKGTRYICVGVCKNLADGLQEACLRAGGTARISTRRMREKTIYTVAVMGKRYARPKITSQNVEIVEDYDDFVYCAQVPHHTLLVRRNGHVAWCGNTWAKLGAQFDVAEETATTFDMASGLVGEGVATEFVAFCKVRAQLVDPAKVFDDPQSALPRPEETLCSPDKLVAMATALGEIGAARSKSKVQKERDDAPLKLLYALAWATRENREYCGAGVSTFIANGGDLAAMVRLARANRKDKVISSLLGFLKSALMQ